MKIEKEEMKISVFIFNIILFIENSKDSTEKLLLLINEFSKVTGYKINTQSQLCF